MENHNPKNKAVKQKGGGIGKGLFYIVTIIIGVILGFAIQHFLYKPNFGTFIGSDMDPAGNVYVLGVNEKNDRYRITKIDRSGNSKFQVDLEKSNAKSQFTYRFVKTDIKGNFYIVKEERNKEAIASDESMFPIFNESVHMYNNNGLYIKEVASIDFSEDANPPVKQYIRKLQIVDQRLTIIGAKNNTYDIITANPLEDKSPQKIRSFEIKPTVDQTDKNVEWVNDIAYLSNGRVLYATKNGKFYAMDNEGSFLDYTDVISRNEISLNGFSVDPSDNLYFTDTLTGSFYKMNTRSISASSVYGLENDVGKGKDIRIKDLRKIQLIGEDDYYAPSKDFNNPFHVRFGSESLIISNMHGSFLPWGLVIALSFAAVFSTIIITVKKMLFMEIKRIPLAVRLTGMFLPVFIILMGVLVYVNTNESANEYISVLRNDQDTGAKIVSDHIDGDNFSKIDHVNDYLTTNYISLKKQLQEGYADLASKIGDRSDYVITYVVKSDKIYSTINSKYKTNSESYNLLRYTDPDMLITGCVLVDYNLERDEVETLYGVLNQFKSEKEEVDIVRASFRDVHGPLSASFSPIKTSDGKIVGFVGNFLDESIHKSKQIFKILNHSSAIIMIITFVVFTYMCFVVMFSLRPLKKLEKAINAMSKGEWDTRVRVTSKDEFADIAEAFNLMSERMDKYTANLILLNDQYVRFVPTEIFKLIDRDKITQVNLCDSKVMHMNVLYLTFNISCKDNFSFKSENELFYTLNQSYSEFFKVVEKNNGVVQSFSGLGATILFPENAQDAFNASVQFKEVFISNTIKSNMNITIGAGEVLIGISGNDTRRGVLVVSDEIMQLFNIDSHLKTIGTNQVATKPVIDNLKARGICNYRFIGRVGNISGNGFVDLYQLIDMSNQYRKDLYMATKEMFENAVMCYIEKDFENARRLFADVLKTNDKDNVSIFYLMKCEDNMDGKISKYDKKDWTGNLFD